MRNGDYQFEGSADDPRGPALYRRLTKADLASSLQRTWLCHTAFLIDRGVLIKETTVNVSILGWQTSGKKGAVDSGQSRKFDHRIVHINFNGSGISLCVWLCMQMQDSMCFYDAITENTRVSCHFCLFFCEKWDSFFKSISQSWLKTKSIKHFHCLEGGILTLCDKMPQ